MPDVPLPPFAPHPLLRSGHVQTLAGAYLPWRYAAHRAVEHRVLLEDDDQIVLHDDQPAGWRAEDGACLLIHGLAGCHLSGYMRRIAAKLVGRGVRAFRMDMRGCGAGEGLARMSTHCGRWPDAAAAVEFIARHAPAAPLALVGFSLGGTIALNLAIELGGGSCGNLHAVMAVCPPVDLHAVRRRFDAPTGRPYDLHFVRLLWKKTCRRMEQRSDLPRLELPRRPRRLREYDEWITAPLAGFASADEYYSQTSPGPRVGAIRLPTAILAAADDPVVPAEPFSVIARNDAVAVSVTRQGGHLGFVARRGDAPDSRWMDWRVVDWVLRHVGPQASRLFIPEPTVTAGDRRYRPPSPLTPG